ncbi:putative leucine-rich repeat domain, L domain-containing protein [Medicago truncatula]|uniref:Putative leucine-rich repeat domain, L domain-containing protein n=1 Tax=Medicago truncatula TaxID=3880 RepID=A0A396IWQ8_MEDTR|nr:putative leucine-rich repeat domain, L domain-containing protein [Medicago truncatula]
MAAGGGLPDDCWEYVISKLVCDNHWYLDTLSLVSKQFLSITNRSVYSLALICNPWPLYCLFQRFPNLKSLDLSGFRGDLNTLLSRFPPWCSITSLNLSNHPTFPVLGLQTILKNTTISSTLTSLTCSNIISLKSIDITFIADSFPFLQDLNISFPLGLSGYEDYNNALKVLTQKLSKLCKVNLSGNIDDSSLLQLCLNCEFLEEVVLFYCPRITDDGMASAICHRPTLTSFSFCNHWAAIEEKNITSSLINSLANLKSLTSLDPPPLRKLVLKDCSNYTYSGIYYLLSKCQSLKHLDIQKATFLNDPLFNKLCAFLGDLVFINVSGCELLTNFALFALLKNCPLLTEIKMESTGIGKVSMPSQDLVVYHQVKSLHLASNSCLRDEDIHMFAFLFPNMQLLDLSSCFYIKEGIDIVLKKCRKIRHFKFVRCRQANLCLINYEASKLEVLNLSNSRIDDKVLYVISMICPRLLQLDLQFCNDVTEKGVRLVVEKCIHLREINLQNCRKVSGNIVSWITFSRPSLRKIAVHFHS